MTDFSRCAVYTVFAVIALSTMGTISCMAVLLFGIISKEEQFVGPVLPGISMSSASAILFAITVACYCRRRATRRYRQREVLFGPENRDPDRIRSIRVLRWVRMMRKGFPRIWNIISLCHVTLCAVLFLLASPTMAFVALMFGVPTFSMIILSPRLVEYLIESLMIMSGREDDPEIELV